MKSFILIYILLFSLYAEAANKNMHEKDKNIIINRSFRHMLYGDLETTPLDLNQTYTSNIVDISEYSIISVLLTGSPSNAKGNLYIEFSPDSINWDRSISIPINNLSSEPPHTALHVARYNRIRYKNNGVAQTSFRIQTIFHRNMSKGVTAQLNSPITDYNDVENSRAISVIIMV